MQVPQQVRHTFYPDLSEAAWRPSANPCAVTRQSYNQPVEFRLRDFRSTDFEAVWRIDQQCFAPGISYSRLDLAAYLRRPRAFALVAVSAEAEQISPGWQTNPHRTSSDSSSPNREAAATGTSSLSTCFPRPARAGVGSRLLLAAEDRLRAANCHSVILETAVDNRSALSFYKRHALPRCQDHSPLLFRRRGRAGAEERFAFAARAS